MRHRVAGNRMGMPEARRRAAIGSLIDGLILHERITTTQTRAKAVQAEAERMITIAMRGLARCYLSMSWKLLAPTMRASSSP